MSLIVHFRKSSIINIARKLEALKLKPALPCVENPSTQSSLLEFKKKVKE